MGREAQNPHEFSEITKIMSFFFVFELLLMLFIFLQVTITLKSIYK